MIKKCLNCEQPIPKGKRKDAVFCNHRCRMVVANARNHAYGSIGKILRGRWEVGITSAPSDVKAAWELWEPPASTLSDGFRENVSLLKKPEIRSEDILKILEELHG